VAELREGLRYTVADLANRLGVSERYVQHVEAGAANLTIESLVKFAAALGVRVADLFAPPAKRERPPGRPAGRIERAPRRRTS
jgi:transcriptional regulator with XRE-family HTH domain